MSPSDYAGIVTCIGALTGGITSVVVALRQSEVKRTLANVNAQVQTPDGVPLGATVTHIHEKVCG